MKGKRSIFNSNKKKVQELLIIIILFAIPIIMYSWTIYLPIIGDGLMHLSDETHFSSIGDFVKVFYTFDGLGKPMNSPTLGFHRPVFNEIIVPIIKNITKDNTMYIRVISILVHCINTVLAYIISKNISKNRYIAIMVSLIFCSNIIYFNGIYEFGLSFSLWLTLFSLLTFLFTIMYENNKKMVQLILAIFTSFLAVFTKESAVVLGIAMSFYIIVKSFYKKRRLEKSDILYVILQGVVILIYFITRYNKLGGFFEIAGGIESNIRIKDILIKLVGYFFLMFDIPNKAIPPYMIGYLDRVNILIAISIVILCFTIIIYGIKLIASNSLARIDIIISIVMYCILISTTFKVNRNSSYYADIAMISMLLYLSIIGMKNKVIYKCILPAYTVICIVSSYSLINSMISDYNWYLSKSTNEANILRDQIKEYIPSKRKIYQASSFLKNSDDSFTFNHGEIGSFMKYNIYRESTVMMYNEQSVNKFDEDSIIIDYVYEEGTNKINVLSKSKVDKDNSIIEIKYKEKNIYDELFEFRYEYEGKVYYQSIDLNYQKSINNSELYFIVPYGVDVKFTNDYVENIKFIDNI
ncbi:MAG: glycosyltransferase family 39 protein [Clostridium neonatale]